MVYGGHSGLEILIYLSRVSLRLAVTAISATSISNLFNSYEFKNEGKEKRQWQ